MMSPSSARIPLPDRMKIGITAIAWFVLVVMFLASLPVVLVWPGTFLAGLIVFALILALPVLGL